MEISRGEGENEVVLTGFWDGDYEVTGTYDEETQSITIPAQVFFTDYGFAYALQCYDIDDDDNVSLIEDPMTLYFDASDNTLMSFDYWGITIYEEDAELTEDNCYGFLDYCMMMVCAPTNGTVSYTYYDEEYEEEYDMEDNVACALEGNTLSVENFGGEGMVVEFTIDTEAKTATASNQYVYYEQDDTGTLYPYFMANAASTTEVVGSITGDNNNIISIEEWFILVDDELYGPYLNTVITTPFDLLSGSGVGSISVDNENAPVEYFNMQGVKVSAPEQGIYIMRQGTKTSKVVVK